MKLCALSGVSSWEDEVRAFVEAEAAPYVQQLRTDALGNLIVFKRGAKAAGNKLLLCAHMDEVGLMVRCAGEGGYVKFDAVGPIDRRVLLGKPVLVGPNRLPGVIGLKAYHLVSREEEKVVPKLKDYYLDIGVQTKEEAARLVSPGDAVVFATKPERFGDGLLKAKALDGRIGCAVLLTLLKEELPMDCTFVFTVQKEVGARGAFGAAFSVRPELALVVEGTAAADLPGVPTHHRGCALGEGAVLTWMDQGSIADRGLFERLRSLAEEKKIPWQLQQTVAASNDAAAIQRTRSGVRTAVLSAPVRYSRTPAGITSVRDMEAVLALSRALLHDVAKEV